MAVLKFRISYAAITVMKFTVDYLELGWTPVFALSEMNGQEQ
jgi:hypothetical protein